MSINPIDAEMRNFLEIKYGKQTECFICGSNENRIVNSIFIAGAPLNTCEKCYYCSNVLKYGKRAGERCNRVMPCKIHRQKDMFGQ